MDTDQKVHVYAFNGCVYIILTYNFLPLNCPSYICTHVINKFINSSRILLETKPPSLTTANLFPAIHFRPKTFLESLYYQFVDSEHAYRSFCLEMCGRVLHTTLNRSPVYISNRFVFSLFTHCEPLEISEGEVGLASAEGGRGTWLDQRTFSTRTFLCHHPQLQPFTFAMFQSQWDTTVQHTFSNVLGGCHCAW